MSRHYESKPRKDRDETKWRCQCGSACFEKSDGRALKMKCKTCGDIHLASDLERRAQMASTKIVKPLKQDWYVGEKVRSYQPGIRPPITKSDYNLFSHWDLNRR